MRPQERRQATQSVQYANETGGGFWRLTELLAIVPGFRSSGQRGRRSAINHVIQVFPCAMPAQLAQRVVCNLHPSTPSPRARMNSARAYTSRQRKGKGGRAGGGGGGTEDDCTADDCVAASGGLRGEAGRVGGGDDIFCLMSCSAACSVAMFWAICSCLAAICSKLRRTMVSSRVIGSSCCANSPAVTAEAGAAL